MIAGGHRCGGWPVRGRVTGLEGAVTSAGADVRWVHEVSPGFDGSLAVGVDGELVARVPAGVDAVALGVIEPGHHRIAVVPMGPEVVTPPDLHGADHGARAWVTWPASTDADTRAYRVYGDAGTGTLDTETVLAEVDAVVVHARPWSTATSGTGTGRVSIEGDWTGAAVNTTFRIEIRAGGKFRHNVSGTWSAERSIAKGRGYVLFNGVRVTFHDDPGDYTTGDQHDFRVGPRTSWSSGELGSGTHQFAVAAVDAAGNEGSATAAAEVRIIRLPEGVTGLSATWDGTEIALAWTLPAGSWDAVRIYANHNLDFDRLEDGIVEAGAWETLAGDATGHTFEPGLEGTWRFVVRLEKDGRVGDDAGAVTVDTALAPPSAGLNVPFDVTVTPGPGGTFTVAWAYSWAEGDDLDHFAVYVHTSETGTFAAPVAEVTPTRGPEPVWRGSWTSGAYGGERWFTVRAVNSEDVETPNTDTTAGTPDATAPTITGDAEVLAN